MAASLPASFSDRALAALGQAVIATDLDGRLQYLNVAAEHLYGYTATEAVGRLLRDLIVPASERGRSAERAGTLQDRPYSGDWLVQDRAGRAFTAHVTATIILDEDGQPVGRLGVSYDATERRRLERDARQLAAIVEGSADAIIQCDPAGVIRTANAAVATILGYHPADLVGQDLAVLIPADQRESILDAVAYARAGGSPDVLHTTNTRADGTEIDVALRLSAVRDETGRIIGISGITRDVTTETRVQAALATSERGFRARFDQAQLPQAIEALDGTLVAVNDALCRLLDRDRAGLEGLPVRDLQHPSDPGMIPDSLADLLAAAGDADTWERTLATRDGSAVPVMIHAALLRAADATPYAIALFVQDLSDLRRAERALTRREALFEALEQQASEWALVIDTHGVPRYLSAALGRTFGYDPESITGRDFVHAEDKPEVDRAMARITAAPGVGETVLFRGADAEGHWRWVETVFTNCLDDPDIAGIVCSGHDVTDRVEAEQELRRQALRDELTGLANRTLLGDRIERVILRQERSGQTPTAVIFADLDQFKLINETWGHAAGDRLLAAVAGRLSGAVRLSDTVARFGGDEFVVVCEDTDEASALAVAARLQAALASPFDIDGRRAYVQVCLGIAISPPHPVRDLLRFADAALYAAKSRGPGRVEVFEVALAEESADRLTLGNDLRDALSRDELALHYQPVVDLVTGALVGVEALARWWHPIRGAVSPVRFVAVAEASGLAPTLNRWALRQASRDVRLLRTLMPVAPRIAVNISVRDLMDADLEAEVLSAVSDGGLQTHGLVLEITESTLMDHPEQTRELLERMRARGIDTSIDDFGTGYSSLSYLRDLPVATLKIDRSFIRNITVDPDSLAITASVIALARSLRLTTIAEGVETIEQLNLLRDLGCDAAQGFLWSPALAPEALAKLIDSLRDRRFAVGLTGVAVTS